MLGDAISFPANSDDWIPTLVIGGLLMALSILVLPAFVVLGYYVRVLDRAARGETEAPSFTDWGGLFADGLKLLIVSLVYSLVIFVPLGAAVGLFATPLATGNSGAASVAGGLLGVASLLLVGALSIVVSYLLPAAYVNVAVEGTVGAAFDFGTILRGALTGDYAVAWFLALVVGVVGGAVATPLAMLVVGLPLLFYVQVVAYYLLGRGFAEGLRSKGEGV